MKKFILFLFFLSISFAQQKWIRTYRGTNEDYESSVWQTSDSGYIVGGSTHSLGSGIYDVYLIKVNASGATS